MSAGYGQPASVAWMNDSDIQTLGRRFRDAPTSKR